jgi:hypothetical protein
VFYLIVIPIAISVSEDIHLAYSPLPLHPPHPPPTHYLHSTLISVLIICPQLSSVHPFNLTYLIYSSPLVPDHGRPSISCPIRSIKMYSWAQCTVQKRLLCSGDVPCVAQEEQGFGSSSLSIYPSPFTWGIGDSVY